MVSLEKKRTTKVGVKIPEIYSYYNQRKIWKRIR